MSTSPTQHIDVERKIIHLMLRYLDSIEEMVAAGLTSQFFDKVHHPLVQAIYNEYLNSDRKRLLTREHYRSTLSAQGLGGGVVLAMRVYDKCCVGVTATTDDLGMLTRQLIDLYVARCSHEFFEAFRVDAKKKGEAEAARNLVEKMNSALTPLDTRKSEFYMIEDLKDDYLCQFEKRLANPEDRIICGIPEIDDPMNVGFRPGQLTLVAADVGGFKSTLMMNIALHLYEKYNCNILFIPLEMSGDDLMNRIISNRTGISFEKIMRPSYRSSDGKVIPNITPEEVQIIKEATIWFNRSQKFAILDCSERTSVGYIRREIEQRIHFFKPSVIVVDYIALMSSDRDFGGRNDLEIGEILKSLRLLGRKYGFHILSAAQIGRAALTKMRQEGFNSVQLDSTALRGSHEYSADADTIFALYPVPDEPDKLKIFTLKARHGPSGKTNELRLKAECCQILSTKDTEIMEEGTDFDLGLNYTPEAAMQDLQEADESEAEKKTTLKFATADLDDWDIG